ncbi:MAG: SDR family NAD(P)-dependent oxidoreductase, partial [Chloroflexi bacterium]|nr:SDR family NAD(P)-dependent oxidoreductase [Chloroflexota bacterium]
ETNVFGTLALTQGFARQMVKRGSGKIVMVTSMGGLVTVPFAGVYCATKHALEALAEALKGELAGTGVEVCTANPGVYGTGFNDRGAETMMRWFDMASSLTRPEVLAAAATGLASQLDPQSMIDAFVRIAEEDGSKFRNVVPDETAEWIKGIQAKTWEAGKDDAIWSSPPTG